jgi:hypothetical protein
MSQIISLERKLIIACDLPLPELRTLLEATSDLEGVGGYKARHAETMDLIGEYEPNKLIIHDQQKWCFDPVPERNHEFLEYLKTRTDAVIGFPYTGLKIMDDVIKYSLENDVPTIIIGGLTTNEEATTYSGGVISRGRMEDLYKEAAQLGVVNFVVPGNNPTYSREVRNIVRVQMKNGVEPRLFPTGFGYQGGSITEFAKIVGRNLNPIIGRGIYWNSGENRYNTAEEMREKTLELIAQLKAT